MRGCVRVRMQRVHDAKTADGRNVQIKATFKNHLTVRAIPDYYLGFKLHQNGQFDEVFNGPGRLIAQRYEHRKGLGSTLLSFPIVQLKELSATVSADQRIARRAV